MTFFFSHPLVLYFRTLYLQNVRRGEVVAREAVEGNVGDDLVLELLGVSAPGHDPGHAGRVDPGREPAEVAVAEEGGGVEEEGGEPGQVEERVLLDRGAYVVGEVQLQPDQGLGADRLDGVAAGNQLYDI